MRFMNILCPVDFSDCSREALVEAVEIAKENRARLTLIHAYQFPTTEGALYVRDMLSQVEAEARQAVAGWAAQARELGAGGVEGSAVVGIAYDEIVKRARELGCDLIVMGTHGRSGLKHAFIGSVAERVVRYAPCTVMVVRAPEKAQA